MKVCFGARAHSHVEAEVRITISPPTSLKSELAVSFTRHRLVVPTQPFPAKILLIVSTLNYNSFRQNRRKNCLLPN